MPVPAAVPEKLRRNNGVRKKGKKEKVTIFVLFGIALTWP